MAATTYRNPYLPPEALAFLRDTSARTILDIGGGVAPHYRATHIVDSLPFDPVRLTANVSGGTRTDPWQPGNYLQLDLCEDRRWPLPDGAIDLALCSHTLEDLPEPRFVIREMARVARQVVIIVPSRLVEHTLHLARPCYAGFRHHSWMIEFDGDRMRLTRKSPVQLKRGCHITCPIGMRLSAAAGASWYYGPPPTAVFQTFATLEEEIRENRAFVRRAGPGAEWVADQPLTFRQWAWFARARLLARWPNGIGKRYVIAPSNPGHS
jgi:SAM-dependent methyltransferase